MLRLAYKTDINKGAKSFQAALSKNSYRFTIKGTDNRKERSSLNKMLNSNPLKEINREWKATEPQNWYSLYNGPKNIQELSESLGVISEYELLYRKWSTKVHAVGSLINLSDRGLKLIRTPDETQSVCTWVLEWSHSLYMEIAAFYSHEVLGWYAELHLEMRESFMKITSNKPLILFKDK